MLDSFCNHKKSPTATQREGFQLLFPASRDDRVLAQDAHSGQDISWQGFKAEAEDQDQRHFEGACPFLFRIFPQYQQDYIYTLSNSTSSRTIYIHFPTARDMRSGYICNACISRSVQYTSQNGAQLHCSADKFTRKGLRQISTQTSKPKHIASAATTNAQKGQKWAHASVTTPRKPQSPAAASQEAVTDSLRHRTSTAPHPNHDLSSTRPARLDLPEGPTKDEAGAITLRNRASYLFQLGKAYVRFYKIGVKNIWSNYKEYRDLRRKFGGTDIHDLVRHASAPTISRREFQLCLRTKHDLKKLIPFGLVFAICGEFTPLVILALGTVVVPYTCRIPKQVKKDLQKVLSRIEHVERLSPPKTETVGITPALGYIHGADPFGLSIRETPFLGPLLQRFWVEPQLKQHLDDIICDAKLINHEGGAARLEPEELYRFCVNIRQVDAMKRMLHHYTQGRQSDLPDSDVEHTRKELQVFLDSVQRKVANPKSTASSSSYQPESIFVAAAKYARSVDREGPYIPPQTARKVKSQDSGSKSR